MPHTVCVCIAIVHIPTVLIFAICYIQGGEGGEGRGGEGGEGERGSLSVMWFQPLTLIVCVLEWKCPVSRAKGVFLLPPCVCPPLTTTGGPPSCPLHAGPS